MTAVVQKYKNSLGRVAYLVKAHNPDTNKYHYQRFNPNNEEYKNLPNAKQQAMLDAYASVNDINKVGVGKFFSGRTVAKAIQLFKLKKESQYNQGQLSHDEYKMQVYNCDGHIAQTSIINIPLKDLQPNSCEIIVNELLAKGCSNSKIGRVLDTLKACIDACINPPVVNGKIPKPLMDANPLRLYTYKPGRRKIKPAPVYKKSDMKLIIDNAPGLYSLMFLFLSQTGLRWQEMAGLMWSRIGWNSNEITVDHVVSRRKNGKAELIDCSDDSNEDGKTEAASRTITVSDNLLSKLKQWQQHSDSDDVFVFGKNKTWIPHATAKDNFNRVKKQLGLSWHGCLHSLRHYYASVLFSQMNKIWDPADVTRQIGHTNIGFTHKKYVKYIVDPVKHEKQINKLNEFYAENG